MVRGSVVHQYLVIAIYFICAIVFLIVFLFLQTQSLALNFFCMTRGKHITDCEMLDQRFAQFRTEMLATIDTQKVYRPISEKEIQSNIRMLQADFDVAKLRALQEYSQDIMEFVQGLSMQAPGPLATTSQPTKIPASSEEVVEASPIVAVIASMAKRKKGNLPATAVVVLEKWLYDNFHNPYPTEAQKEVSFQSLSNFPQSVSLS
jgi:hypothetical protein